MTEALVLIGYAVAVVLSGLALYLVRWRSLRFLDGILIGSVYYVVAPFALILAHGELPSGFIQAPAYNPFEDVGTSAVLIGGMMLMPVLSILTRPVIKPVDRTDPRLLKTILVIFALSSIYALVNSGILSGGHWYHATSDALESSGSFLLVKHLANFSRTAVFGVLLYWHLNKGLSRRATIGIGVLVVLADLLMTFNRVTGVYLIIMLIVVYRRNLFSVAALLSVILFVLPPLSNMWPMFRGLIGAKSFSVENVVDAAATSFEKSNAEVPAIQSLNGVFESINIVVLNYVVTHSGKDLPLRRGEMFIRPLTFYLPAMVWKDRPANFGTTLGQEINDNDDLALNSTLFGEPYANFGAYWWIALTALLLAYEYLVRWLGRSSSVVGFIAAFIAFAMWRFDSVFGVISIVLTTLLLVGLHLVRPRRRATLASALREGSAGQDDPPASAIP